MRSHAWGTWRSNPRSSCQGRSSSNQGLTSSCQSWTSAGNPRSSCQGRSSSSKWWTSSCQKTNKLRSYSLRLHCSRHLGKSVPCALVLHHCYTWKGQVPSIFIHTIED
jgi:hypothetical protein